MDDVGVDAEGDGRAGVSESGRHDADGDAGQEERGRVDMAEVVKPRVGERDIRLRLVVCVDQLWHEGTHRVGVDRLGPSPRSVDTGFMLL
ncbi:hypothetical protein GCM10023075_72230 [Streptosporangium album]